jgi:hypothetical protein
VYKTIPFCIKTTEEIIHEVQLLFLTLFFSSSAYFFKHRFGSTTCITTSFRSTIAGSLTGLGNDDDKDEEDDDDDELNDIDQLVDKDLKLQE